MKVLILGGTGAMGVHLVSLLSEIKSHQICITTRGQKKSKKTNVSYIQGNALDLEFIEKLLHQKWDVIIDFMLYKTPVFKERMQTFLDATNQYVFISSARVYGNNDPVIKENTLRILDSELDKEFLATDEYSLAKARQEDLLINSSKKNWTIIRPYITYSSDRLQLGVLEKEDWLYRALQGRTIVFSEEIFSKLTAFTHGLDVSRGIFNVIGETSACGEVFHITSNESKTWGEILNIYMTILEKKIGIKPKYKLQKLNDFLKHHHAKPQIIYDRIYHRKFDNNKIAFYTEVSNFIEVEKGLEKCLEDFLKNPIFKRIDWLKEAIKDRETRERASLYEIKSIKDKVRYLIYRYIIRKNINN